jgi:DNA repair protein RadA
MAKEKSVKELEDLPGIGPTTADKLRANGFDNIEKVAASSPYELSEVTGISIENAKKAIEALKKLVEVKLFGEPPPAEEEAVNAQKGS